MHEYTASFTSKSSIRELWNTKCRSDLYIHAACDPRTHPQKARTKSPLSAAPSALLNFFTDSKTSVNLLLEVVYSVFELWSSPCNTSCFPTLVLSQICYWIQSWRPTSHSLQCFRKSSPCKQFSLKCDWQISISYLGQFSRNEPPNTLECNWQ